MIIQEKVKDLIQQKLSVKVKYFNLGHNDMDNIQGKELYDNRYRLEKYSYISEGVEYEKKNSF